MVIPLAGRDGQILKFVGQVVAIGRNRKAWDAADVARVTYDHLPHPRVHEREAKTQRDRADKAEAHAALLKQRVRELEQQLRPAFTDPWQPPTPVSHRRSVELTPLQARIFTEFAKGRAQTDIADDLDMGRTAVTNHIHRASNQIGADSPAHAVSLVLRNVVEIRVRKTRRKAAA